MNGQPSGEQPKDGAGGDMWTGGSAGGSQQPYRPQYQPPFQALQDQYNPVPQPQQPPQQQSGDLYWETTNSGAPGMPHQHAWEQAPQGRSGGSRTGLIVGLTIAAVVALAGVGAGTYFVVEQSNQSTGLAGSDSGSGSGSASGDGPQADSTGNTGAGGQSEWRSESTTSSPTSTAPARPTTNAEAERELDRIIAESDPRVEAVEYQWIPQLSSKQPGFYAEGQNWDHLEILREFEAFKDKYPNAALLRSDDWGVFRAGWYVTVVVEPSSTPGPVLNWCLREGYSRDHCLAKNIQRHGSSTGTTRTN